MKDTQNGNDKYQYLAKHFLFCSTLKIHTLLNIEFRVLERAHFQCFKKVAKHTLNIFYSLILLEKTSL